MFNKSRSLFFLSSIIILSIILSACGGKVQQATAAPDANVTTEPAVASNKNIRIVIAEDPPSFNPIVADTGYDALVMELVMLGLTDIDPNGNVFAELAAVPVQKPETGAA